MAESELNQTMETLKDITTKQQGEIVALKAEIVQQHDKIAALQNVTVQQHGKIVALQNETVALQNEIGHLQAENLSLHAKVDELRETVKFLVDRYESADKKAEKSLSVEPMLIDVPIKVLPTVSNSATNTSETDLADAFAKLPTDKLAAEMWTSTIANMPELNGPTTAELLEKKIENFTEFITTVSAKQNFCDAVKRTCLERGFSKGIARKMQKLANNVRVPDDA